VSLFLVRADRMSLYIKRRRGSYWNSDRSVVSLYAGGGDWRLYDHDHPFLCVVRKAATIGWRGLERVSLYLREVTIVERVSLFSEREAVPYPGGSSLNVS
jgi:hypothetical protein